MGGEQVTVNTIQKEVISQFEFPGEVVECVAYGSGHINDTYRLTVKTPGGQENPVARRFSFSSHEIEKSVPRDRYFHLTGRIFSSHETIYFAS